MSEHQIAFSKLHVRLRALSVFTGSAEVKLDSRQKLAFFTPDKPLANWAPSWSRALRMCAGLFRWLIFSFTTSLFLGCAKTDAERSATPVPGSAAPSESSVATRPKNKFPPATRREGSTISRAPQDDALFVADEDHQAICVLPLPLAEDTKVTTISVPGHSAQIIASRNQLLVTLRDTPEGGGALMIVERDGATGLNEVACIALPADSWGLAIFPDESLAVVSNAWTASVSIVDIDKRSVKATLPVTREPRGVTILPDVG